MKLLFMATTKSHTVFSHYRSIFTVNLGIMDLPSGIASPGEKASSPNSQTAQKGNVRWAKRKKNAKSAQSAQRGTSKCLFNLRFL